MAKTKIEPERKKDDPCHKGYAMLGMKEKNGKKVPDCVKQKRVEK